MSTVLADANGVVGSSHGKVSACAIAQVAQVLFLDTSDLEGIGYIVLKLSLLGFKEFVVQVLHVFFHAPIIHPFGSCVNPFPLFF